MSYTLTENGTALTETQDGVTMPVDYSFACVNEYVHGLDVQYEWLQALCLGMAIEIERLQKIEAIAKNLITQKGRHNTEIAYKRLEDTLKTRNV